MIKRFVNAWDLTADRQCTIYFLSSTGKWRTEKKSRKRLIKTNVVCKWSLLSLQVCSVWLQTVASFKARTHTTTRPESPGTLQPTASCIDRNRLYSPKLRIFQSGRYNSPRRWWCSYHWSPGHCHKHQTSTRYTLTASRYCRLLDYCLSSIDSSL